MPIGLNGGRTWSSLPGSFLAFDRNRSPWRKLMTSGTILFERWTYCGTNVQRNKNKIRNVDEIIMHIYVRYLGWKEKMKNNRKFFVKIVDVSFCVTEYWGQTLSTLNSTLLWITLKVPLMANLVTVFSVTYIYPFSSGVFLCTT